MKRLDLPKSGKVICMADGANAVIGFDSWAQLVEYKHRYAPLCETGEVIAPVRLCKRDGCRVWESYAPAAGSYDMRIEYSENVHLSCIDKEEAGNLRAVADDILCKDREEEHSLATRLSEIADVLDILPEGHFLLLYRDFSELTYDVLPIRAMSYSSDVYSFAIGLAFIDY